MTHIRDIIEIHLNEKESEEFAKWAFGDDFRTFDINHTAHIRWNYRHGDILKINADDSPKEDIPKMIKLWKTSSE